MTIRNRFGWSISRQSLFDECRRRYFYHYYLSWGGWRPSSPAVVREAFKLKRLVTPALWRGQLVHYITAKVLQSTKVKGRVPELDDVIRYTMERFERQLEFSAEKRYRVEPKKRGSRLNIDWLALIEHEYGRELDEERIEHIRSECRRGIEGLYKSPILELIGSTDRASWMIEDLDHAAFSQSFLYGGVTVFAKTDFIFKGEGGTFNIVDWKTNRPVESREPKRGMKRDARVQLGIYGYWASSIHKVPAELIRLFEVNLLEDGIVMEYPVTEQDIRLFEERIGRGIEELSSVLVEGDTERNEPLEPGCFPQIENGLCRRCNFFRICKDRSYPNGIDS